MGRDSIIFKPFQYNTGRAYDYNGGITSQDAGYYNSNVYSGITDNYPYTTNEYYSDGRTKDIKPSGQPWQTHDIQYSYGTNVASDVAGYSAGTLYKTAVTDENGVKRLEFRDYFGNLVQTVTDSAGLQLKTQYNYNLAGDMTKSIPPNASIGPTTYAYNTLSEVTEKTSPDAGTTQYLYDRNGNLRFIKDANHTGTTNSASWPSLIIGAGSSQQNLTLTMPGTMVISLSNYGSYSTDNITATIKTLGGTVLATYSVSVSQSYGTTSVYLPKGTYQCVVTTSDYYGGDEFDWDIYSNTNYEFQFRMYDALNRLTQEGMTNGSTASGDFTQANADNENFPNESGGYNAIFRRAYFYDTPSPDANASGQRNIKGRLSYTQAYDVNGNVERTTSYSYDNMGRVAWMVIDGATWYPKKMTFSYDLQGNITEKGYIDFDWRNVAFYTDYAYDQAGRLETVKTTTGDGSYTTEAAYDYFASGKPSRLALGSLPAATVTYNYNERDWLTNINSSQFWEHLGYNVSSEIGGTPQYNGNISWMTDYMQGMSYQDPYDLYFPTSIVGYSYLYDNLSRLTRATFGFYADDGDGHILWRSPEGSYNMPAITYDNDGNINNLERNGSGTGAMDNLYYYYTSGTDRLTQIWNQVNNVTSTYSYDSNGNIISDDHSSIAYTLYDIYNEPVEVFKTNGTEYTYGYDVNGARIFKNPGGGSSYVFYANGPSGETEAVHLQPYSSNVDYNIWAGSDNIAQVRYTYYDSYSRYYYLKDHLGYISMIVNQNGGVDSYNNYYPFGEQMR